MAAQHKSRSSKSLAFAIAALAVATLSYTLSGVAIGCFLNRTSWFAADILCLLILRADWHILIPYLCHGSCLVKHFLQFTACF